MAKETQKVDLSLKTAAEICQRFELGDEARALLNPKQKPSEFFSLLSQKKLYPDALRFAAYYLPPRKAVWWGCLCAWEIYRPRPPEKIAAALQATVHWVQEPSEETRRAAAAASAAAGVTSPAGQLALAAFLSGGSISRPGLPEVQPGKDLTAKTVAGAVLLASSLGKPGQLAERRLHFQVLASDVASGRLSWETETPASLQPG